MTMTRKSDDDSGLVTSGDTTTGSPFIQKMEHLSDEGADVLALNAAAAFKMLGLIWQSLISSLPLQALNFVEKKRRRLQAAQERSMSTVFSVTLKNNISLEFFMKTEQRSEIQWAGITICLLRFFFSKFQFQPNFSKKLCSIL